MVGNDGSPRYLEVRPAVIQDPMSRLADNAAVLKGAESLTPSFRHGSTAGVCATAKLSRIRIEWSAYTATLPDEDDTLGGPRLEPPPVATDFSGSTGNGGDENPELDG